MEKYHFWWIHSGLRFEKMCNFKSILANFPGVFLFAAANQTAKTAKDFFKCLWVVARLHQRLNKHFLKFFGSS